MGSKKKDAVQANKKRKNAEETNQELPGLSKEDELALQQRFLWIKTQQDEEPIKVKVSVPCIEVESKKDVSIEFYALWISTAPNLQSFEIHFKFENETHIVNHFKDWLKKIKKWSHDGYITQYASKTFDLWNNVMVEILPRLDEKEKIWSNLTLVIPPRFQNYMKRYKDQLKKAVSPVQKQTKSTIPLAQPSCFDVASQTAEIIAKKMDFIQHILSICPKEWNQIEPRLASIFHKKNDIQHSILVDSSTSLVQSNIESILPLVDEEIEETYCTSLPD